MSEAIKQGKNMLAAKNADRNRSNKRMEDNGGLKTIEGLRGRLLAERVASKVAKEDAELLGNKLVELENQLRLEIKSKMKAEKKLKSLIEKLSSLKINNVLGDSEQYLSSSEYQEQSCRSSSEFSCTKDLQEHKTMIQSENMKKYSKENNSETTTHCQNQSSPRKENSSSSAANFESPRNHKDVSMENSMELESNQSCVTEDSNHRLSDLKSSMRGVELDEEVDELRDNYADNSLALVLVPPSLQLGLDKVEQLKVSRSVGEVLDTLKHTRENIQSSLERRHTIKVGQ